MRFQTKCTMPSQTDGVDVMAVYDKSDFKGLPAGTFPESALIARFFGQWAEANADAYCEHMNREVQRALGETR